METIELKMGDYIAHTYKGELELARIVMICRQGNGAVQIELPARKDIDGLPDNTTVTRCAWKRDMPQARSMTTLGAIRHKLR